jgi:aspartyl-tRNA(Asn)/glutamyl-tRNA(Gln) amidotransferase subunit A
VFGIKPTFGRVPAYPLSPFGTVAHLGPMSRTVADSALMLSVMAEPDARDVYALPYDSTDYTQGLEDGVAGFKIGFSPSLGGHHVEPEIARLVAAAAESFQDLGATIEVADPDLPDCGPIFRVLWYAGAANLLSGLSAAAQEAIDPGLRQIAAEGAEISLLDYLAAVKGRELAGLAMNRYHQRYDLLLTPSLPLPAFQAGLEYPPKPGDDRWVDWTPFTYPFNMTQQPAASIPCGLTDGGLPAGLQIVGPRYGEAKVLRAARAFEAARPSFPLPPL